MLRLTRPSEADLRQILERATRAQPSYSEAGAGYRLDKYERRLGSGLAVFDSAIRALRSWQAQIGAGVRVFPDGSTVESAATVVFVLRTLGLWAIAPCRVVDVSSEPGRFAFVYGTLPGHPEQGEVTMAVVRESDDDVVARIESFSRTVDPLARAAGPLTRSIQTRVTRRYLEALANVSKGV